jgi:DNA-binding transcriptional LysR family regulator
MEIRQLEYFATLAEELHFGHAAARHHIVQSVLSQQIQRLEGELGVSLVERNTHRVRLTASGEPFLHETRQILDHLQRAVAAARTATRTAGVLRVGICDASHASMPELLRVVQHVHPLLEIRQIEVGVPQQYRMLTDGQLDIGLGRAWLVSPQIAVELLRLDPIGILVADKHRLAGLSSAPVELLAGELLVLPDEDSAPEFHQFVFEMCRSAGFTPMAYRGTVQSVLAAAHLVESGGCVACVHQSCRLVWPGTRMIPLLNAPPYPWSLLWRADNPAGPVAAVLECARKVACRLRWLEKVDAKDRSEPCPRLRNLVSRV